MDDGLSFDGSGQDQVAVDKGVTHNREYSKRAAKWARGTALRLPSAGERSLALKLVL